METEDAFPYLKIDILNNLTREETQYTLLSKDAAKDIDSKKVNILELIKKLECLLLSESFSKRDMGVLILSETLRNIGSQTINTEQLSILSAYFNDKLKDHHQVATTALKGVLALVNFNHLPNEASIQLLSSIFNHIGCQQQQQQDRHLIFEIYETILKQHSQVINLMGIDFVYGVISSIDGERDPKNLIYLFDWMQTFLKSVNLGHLTEEMFDVLSCYFPVDFKAPSDKNIISREDLASGLCKCLTSIPDFAQFAIPLALEKLDSGLKIAKEDSLDLLKAGCLNYTPEAYFQYSVELWSRLQKEIFLTTDAELVLKCLHTFKEIVTKLSTGDQKNFKLTIEDIVDHLKGNLLPYSKLFQPSRDILIHVSKASSMSSLIVVQQVAPLLLNIFVTTENTKQKAVILQMLTEFVKILLDTNQFSLSDIEIIAHIPNIYGSMIVDGNDDDLIIEGYRGFVEVLPFSSSDLRRMVLEKMKPLVVLPLAVNVKQAMIKLLQKVATLFPQEVEQHILTLVPPTDLLSVENYLETIACLVDLQHFQYFVVNTFIGYSLNRVICSSTIALSHLNKILNSQVITLLINADFMNKLFNLMATQTSSDRRLLRSVNQLIGNVIRTQDAESQIKLYSGFGGTEFLDTNVYASVLRGVIVPLRRGVFGDYHLIEFLTDIAANATDECLREDSLEALANILNKLQNESVLEEKLNKIMNICNGCTNETKVYIVSCVTKALLMRNHPTTWQWTDRLLDDLLNNPFAAKGFRIVMSDSPILSMENYCQITPLYKQKFFVYCTNKLRETHCKDDASPFNALGYLIENAPKTAIIGQFNKLLKLLLLCMEKSQEPKVLEVILQLITDCILNYHSLVMNSLEDILTRVLDLTTFEAAMMVRLAAIRCLQAMLSRFQVYHLLPFKLKVIQILGICVDDKKRLVRREAMECRSLWYLLDAQ